VIAFVATDVALRSAATTFEFSADVDSVLMTAWAALRPASPQRYAIRDMDQARRYLAGPILGDRLRHDVRLMIRHKRQSALEILGSPDELKFWPCLTLFREAASDKSDHSLFAEALEQFYNGKPDPRTRELLRCE
jgi:uncharacterized protein (DUF1810 family)